MATNIRIAGIDEVLDSIENLADINKFKKRLGKACALVERVAKEKVPKDTSHLRKSITSAVYQESGELVGVVFTPLEYAPYVEYGTGLFAKNGGSSGYWVFVDDENYDPNKKGTGKRYTLEEAKRIVAILRSKGIKAYYSCGQHPQPFLHPALHESRENIIRILKGGSA